jgi:hypothetical protein
MSFSAKRTQEMLMFGNQQNHQANVAGESFTLNAEKREYIAINITLLRSNKYMTAILKRVHMHA